VLRSYFVSATNSDNMGEVPLARLWQLPDGTTCLLSKDPRAENWRLRVVRGNETLRAEHFGSPIVAMDQAKIWRASYDRSVETSH
jgi:hypothetical protein